MKRRPTDKLADAASLKERRVSGMAGTIHLDSFFHILVASMNWNKVLNTALPMVFLGWLDRAVVRGSLHGG